MSTTITRRPGTGVRTTAKKMETALVAAFRRMAPRERVRLLRAAKHGGAVRGPLQSSAERLWLTP